MAENALRKGQRVTVARPGGDRAGAVAGVPAGGTVYVRLDSGTACAFPADQVRAAGSPS